MISDALNNNRFRRDTTEPSLIQRIWDHHQYYTTTHEENAAEWYWQELGDDTKHHNLSDSPGGYEKITVDFEFEFYGHKIKHVYLSTAGILSMSPFKVVPSSSAYGNAFQVFHYIAPLYGDFNPSFSKDSAIFFENRGEMFLVEWRNVYMRNHTELGPFSFQAQVNKNGTIIFVYTLVPQQQNRTFFNDLFLIGLVGSLPIEVAGIEILAYYDPVRVFPFVIRNGLVLTFNPLPTCDQIKDMDSCVSSTLPFACQWCSVTQRCSDALDKYTRQWKTSGCWKEEMLRAAQDSTSTTERSHSNSTVVAIVVVVLVIALFAAVGGWFLYAYKNPGSKSGIWLIEHRPSRLMDMLTSTKRFSRKNEEQTT